ncbi:MAG: secernin-3 [Clostridiales bacterium]|nr:secernin-3 [Clostridiales bacterium]
MLSCDTLVALGNVTSTGRNLFAKNSDRPLEESQPLVYLPAASHPAGATLRCTHIEIPEAASTFALLASKPYWMWGCEIGVNERGVVIGNEAEDSNLPLDGEEGLLGMDLVRLGLERGATAHEAMHVMADLLGQYGQNANAHVRADYRYDNSYIIADAKEAWVLETAGRRWVAKRVTSYTAISNCYSIHDDYDEGSDDVVAYARSMRLLAPGAPFDFARAFTRMVLRQQRSLPRYRRLLTLLERQKGTIDKESVVSILRDHFEDALLAPRYGAGDAQFASVCMHALTEKDSKTAASLIVTWHDVLGVTCRHCFSNPCTSAYIPIYMTGHLPASFQQGGGTFSPDSLWWVMERLHCAVEADSFRFAPRVREALDALEREFSARAGQAEAQAVSLHQAGRAAEADALLNDLMDDCALRLCETANAQFDQIKRELELDGGLYGSRAAFLRGFCQRTRIEFVD